MSLAALPSEAESFFPRYSAELTAVGVLLLTVVVLVVVHRIVAHRGRDLAATVGGGDLRPEVDTRLRFLQRLVDAVIVIAGLALALQSFDVVGDVAGTILTSGAIAAAVVGFAARQTLANAIAGVLLAVTQPLRIGDVVTFEGQTGVVEDVRLTYTWLRTPGDARVIVPNERLAAGVLRNDSIASPTVAVESSIWLHRDIGAIEALDALRAALDVGVTLAETTSEGTRLLLLGAQAAPNERLGLEHELREAAFRALRDAGVVARGGNGAPDGERGSRALP